MNFSLCSDSDLELPWGFVPESSHYFSVPNFPTRFDCCATGLNGNSFITSQTLVVVDCPFTAPLFFLAEVILQCYRTGFRHLEMIGGPPSQKTRFPLPTTPHCTFLLLSDLQPSMESVFCFFDFACFANVFFGGEWAFPTLFFFFTAWTHHFGPAMTCRYCPRSAPRSIPRSLKTRCLTPTTCSNFDRRPLATQRSRNPLSRTSASGLVLTSFRSSP